MSECIHCGAEHDPDHGIAVRLVGEVTEPTCNHCRGDQLADATVLKRREAEVRALKECGWSHSKIADGLGIAKSTVDEYSRRINDRLKRSQTTVAWLIEE
jgi:DNA-binding NarL/FixJ family response regulator